MEESEREIRKELSSGCYNEMLSLTACKQQNTGGKDEAATDRKLDISSDEFDPLLALYSSQVPLPFPHVRCFNNLAEYESFMSGGRGRAKPENVEKKMRKAKRGVKDPERIERLKQLMVKNPSGEAEESGMKRPAKRTTPKNVLTRMPLHEGSPLGELNRCVQQRLRVKVHIRSFKGLRGVCTGFVVAFDKFWNLAMVDVDETYREPLLGEAFYHEKALTVTRLFQKLQVQAASDKAAAEAGDSKIHELCVEQHHVSTSSVASVPKSKQATARLAQCVKTLAVTGTDISHISGAGLKQRPKTSKPRVEYGKVHRRHVNQLFIRGENVLLLNIQH
ncbi:U7 snRNA-associated Sm-like protein LSm11 [Tachysurus fulvidraco]|uniref:U7 snRNA-associated Sm-like protein LSm11 n=1 Tax=Tachysurus fulvidraco TaxID=1234273 RepID=UPI000F4FD61E|nr:U7 snRNA-associated Sm-like protein LSm11 [Tachysurus fulvidraco]